MHGPYDLLKSASRIDLPRHRSVHEGGECGAAAILRHA